jgi:hypothetical protein
VNLQQFAEQVVNDPQYRQTLIDRARAGTLPPDVEMFLLETADGRVTLSEHRPDLLSAKQSHTLALVEPLTFPSPSKELAK